MSIRFEAVSRSFGDRVILNQISFEVPQGDILFILGKSGVGKSVTLQHIIGLLRPSSGKIFVDQFEVSLMNDSELANVRQICGMVFQQPALLDSLSVFENIAFGLKTPQYILKKGKKSFDEIQRIVHEKLDLVHLPRKILSLFPPELSYGMQKRVSLARTLAPSPQYLLFDEPTTGLDPITTQSINRLIQELSEELKVTSIVVSHDMNCALQIAKRILVLDQGQILKIGTVTEIENSSLPLIQDFLQEVREARES